MKKGCFITLVILIVSVISGFFFIRVVSRESQKRIVSPGGKYVATSFILNGGATTSYSPQVSMRKAYTMRIALTGNIFRGCRSRYIDIEWKDENTLIIYHGCEPENIYQQEETYRDIKIEYIKKQTCHGDRNPKAVSHPSGLKHNPAPRRALGRASHAGLWHESP
jgi:hypothetical protein